MTEITISGLGVTPKQSDGIPLETMPPISLDEFERQIGLSSVTLWRFRKRGWLKTTIIAGRHYVSRAAIAEFNRRAAAGEFAGKVSNPSKSLRKNSK